MNRLFISISFLLLTIPSIGFSQIKKAIFKNYTEQNGLNGEKAHAILQDANGLIWLGTDFGVVQFDAYTFKSFKTSDSVSLLLENSLIRSISEDCERNIWIGTELNGLFIYNPSKDILRNFQFAGKKQNSIWSIFHLNNETCLLGTANGVIVFNTKQNTPSQMLNNRTMSWETGDIIHTIFMDNNSKIWLGTNHGITILNSDFSIYRNKFPSNERSGRHNEIRAIYQDSEQQIWVGTYLDGLMRYCSDKDSFTRFTLDSTASRSATVRTITQDLNGDLWFGTRAGLYSYDYATQKVKKYTYDINQQQSLVHNSVLTLMVDKKGDLWAGTRNGISFLNFEKEAFGYVSANHALENELNNGEVYCLWEDENRKLWVGTENGGINIIDEENGTIQYITKENGLSSNCIKDIEPLDEDHMLIATYLGGLNILDRNSGAIRVLKHDPDSPSSISDNSIWDIFTDSENRIWIATSKGLDLFAPKNSSFTHFKDQYKLGLVEMVFEDTEKNLWVYSAENNHLTKIKENGNVNTYPIKTRAMTSDREGNLWVASLGEGLICIERNSQKPIKYKVDKGICSNIVLGIINCDDSFLWLSTNNGLSCFDIKQKAFTNYNTGNGLLNSTFNYGAYLKRKNGDLVFGGKKGIDIVYTHKLRKNEYPAPVIFTEFSIFNEPVSSGTGINGILTKPLTATKKIELAYNQNMLSFEFAALNYANSDQNTYEYKLEGFDKSWNRIGTARKASYTNLDNGTYKLLVIGRNSNQLACPAPAEITITIKPPYWKTWWFIAGSLAITILIILALYKQQLKKVELNHQLVYERRASMMLQDIERSKHQFFMNISHELRTPLSLIIGPLKKLEKDATITAPIKEYVNLIKKNAENLHQLVNQLLDYRKLESGNMALNPKTGNLEEFVHDIVSSFSPASNEKGISLTFDSKLSNKYADFDSTLLSKILNNLISNAIKYSHKNREVKVSLAICKQDFIFQSSMFTPNSLSEMPSSEKYIQISVEDQGIGIEEEDIPKIFTRFKRLDTNPEIQAEGTGIGLSLTKDLINIHKGLIFVKSEWGSGSIFHVCLPYSIKGAGAETEILSTPGADAPISKDSNQDNSKAVVLIVDDNKDLRRFTKGHFEPEYHVLEAENGKKAWDTAIETVPDIVIADVMMPVMNGKELCRKLKKDERTSHIPVIILSALSSNKNQLDGIDAGADDYLTKPFDADLLKAKADNLLLIRKKLRERYCGKLSLAPSEVVLPSPDEKFIKKFTAFIEKNIADTDLDVEVIAMNIGVSRTQLYRKIKALTGSSPKEIVRDFRLSRATQLLVQQKINISEVSIEVGFSDAAYFRKCFKSKYGMNPTEYVRKHAVKQE